MGNGARGDAICAHLCSFASAADGAGAGLKEEAGHQATRRLLIISRAFLWPATVGGAQYVDTITFRQTDRQTEKRTYFCGFQLDALSIRTSNK